MFTSWDIKNIHQIGDCIIRLHFFVTFLQRTLQDSTLTVILHVLQFIQHHIKYWKNKAYRIKFWTAYFFRLILENLHLQFNWKKKNCKKKQKKKKKKQTFNIGIRESNMDHSSSSSLYFVREAFKLMSKAITFSKMNKLIKRKKKKKKKKKNHFKF